MRFFTAALIALSTLAATVFAAENPITYPGGTDKLKAGETIVIKWSPTTPDKTVTLIFREGPEGNLNTIGPIVVNCPNSGSYSWTVPKDVVSGKDYAIEIKYTGGVNYSPQFEIDSSVTARTTTTATTATATTASTATTEASNTTTTTTSTTSSTTTGYPTTTLITTTSAPNMTVSTQTITATTSKSKTTEASSTGTGAPNPHNSGAGMGKTMSGGLVAIVAAAWALTL